MKLMHSVYAAFVIVLATPAYAVVPAWSAAAATCIPSAEAIVNKEYETDGYRLALRSNKPNDSMSAFCDINGPIPAGSQWRLVITYRDSSGTAFSAAVQADLTRVSRTNGARVTVAQFNSNTSPALAVNKGSIAFTHTFNLDASYYFVTLFMHRALTTQIVEVYGVSIERVP